MSPSAIAPCTVLYHVHCPMSTGVHVSRQVPCTDLLLTLQQEPTFLIQTDTGLQVLCLLAPFASLCMYSEEHSLQEPLRRCALNMHPLFDQTLSLQLADTLQAVSRQTSDQGLHSAAQTLISVSQVSSQNLRNMLKGQRICVSVGTIAHVPALDRPLPNCPKSVVREGRAVRHCPPTGKPGQCVVEVSAKASHESIVSSYKKSITCRYVPSSRMQHPVDIALQIRASLECLKRAWMHCQNRC